MSVKNGAELLDRLMKDIVAEAAQNYISIYPNNTNPNLPSSHDLHSKLNGLGISPSSREKEEKDGHPDARHANQSPAKSGEAIEEDKRAFSLARFIPLLAERVYVISPYTRMHLVSWLMVLDSVPDVELVAWLPEFLDGLLKYLADGNIDVRLATENLLAEFLREIKYIANVQDKQAEGGRARREAHAVRRRGSKHTMESAVDEEAIEAEVDGDASAREGEGDDAVTVAEEHDWEGEGSGAWVPGQGVYVDHAAIMDTVIQHLLYPGE